MTLKEGKGAATKCLRNAISMVIVALDSLIHIYSIIECKMASQYI
jgi:hypothetical protein